MIIGIVCSDNDAGRAALENIRAGREHADGYVWYGPVTHHFESDPGFVAFRARWEKQHGQPLDIRQVWGLMAQWIPGATFIRHEDLRLIVDKAVEVRFGGNKEAVDA